MAKRTRKQKNRDENLAIVIGGLALVCQIEHWWGYVALAAGASGAAYVALRLRRRAARRSSPAPAPRMGKPKAARTERCSSECAGNDHDACFDRVCNCRCGHAGRKPKVTAGARSYPLPADVTPEDIEAAYGDEIPF